jgi:hypothetical protein
VERSTKVAIVVVLLATLIALACGGARKPCDAPIQSLDEAAAPSTSAN